MKVLGKVLAIVFGIYMVIGGFYCLFNPAATYLVIGYVVGLSMVFDAITRFIFWSQARKDGEADGWMLTL